MLNHTPRMPRWSKTLLQLAGIYNVGWGLFAISFPTAIFRWSGAALPTYPELWQCIGMIVGVYGVGYWIAAYDPARYWPIILVGLLGKIFGPIGFVSAVATGRLPANMGWTIVTNDLIWWVPFALILWHAFGDLHLPRSLTETERNLSLRDALANSRSQLGNSLLDLSQQRPTLVVFLRHAGCTFCREALADLAIAKPRIEAHGTHVAVVHMNAGGLITGHTCPATTQLRIPLEIRRVDFFADHDQLLYRAFQLVRGRFAQLFGPAIWWPAFRALFVERHGFGRLSGDGLQMAGVFVISKGEILRSYRHRTAASRPDYVELVCSASRAQSEVPADGAATYRGHENSFRT